jgi:hypothetical protein
MITNFNPAVSNNRMNNNIKFGDKLPKEKLLKAIEEKDASRINTYLGMIGAGTYTKAENKGIMEEITKKHGGNPVVGAINKAFGFNFPKK